MQRILGSERFGGFLGRAAAGLRDTYSDALVMEDLGGIDIRHRIDDRRQVNASVQWDDHSGCYQISISIGLCVWAYAIANAFGAVESGDADTTITRPIGMRDFRADASRAELRAIVREVDASANPEFRAFSEYMFTIILALVAGHELAHVTQGHVDFLKGTTGEATGLLDELGLRHNAPELAPEILNGIEFEADNGAAHYAATAALSDSGVFGWLTEVEHHRRLSLAILGFAILAAAMEEDDRILETRSAAYPEPFLRVSIFSASLRKFLLIRGMIAEEVDDIFIAAFQMLAAMSPVYPNLDLYRFFVDDGFRGDLEAASGSTIENVLALDEQIKPYRLRPSIAISQWHIRV